MTCRSRIAAGLMALGFAAVLAPGTSLAEDHFADHGLIYKSKHQKSNVATPHTFHQAGHPECVSAIAHPSYNEHYSGGYVGGGTSHGGRGRCANEGTWGWDYTPFRPLSPRIFLNWSHGRKVQGGTRGYATDGPKPIEEFRESVHEHHHPE
ncbi:hypothetical protein P12x_001063 [Tundrisphaera lichenicola]|uniref:hypothetical protein n=1 Tax=Tundrisphaera lichenicola TaxID=2029860 RepID=UPI003EB9790B